MLGQNGVLNCLETFLGNLQQPMLASLTCDPAIAVVVAFSWRDLGLETAKVSERFEFGDGDVEKGRQPASCRDAWNGPVMRSGFHSDGRAFDFLQSFFVLGEPTEKFKNTPIVPTMLSGVYEFA
jgi:hypothetical protein